MTPPKRSLFCLIDASSFIFRAFYAVRPLSNKAGLPTNAIFGFANMILKVLEEMQPSHIAVVYDTKHPSFRKELYSEYKANRSSMPEDLVPQIPYIKKFVESLGLPAFERQGFEADDLIATLAERAAHLSGEPVDVCIVSSDKDLMQLVNGSIYLYDTMKDKKFYPEDVKEKLGVPPAQVADFLGIVGDSSDNIPGVKGVGPIGAIALLEQFGSLENIYKNLSSLKKENQRKQFQESEEIALLSKKLATVIRDLPIETDWHSLRCEPQISEDLSLLLAELDFNALEKRIKSGLLGSAKDLEKETPNASDEVFRKKKAYHILRNTDDLERVLEKMPPGGNICIDTETTDLHVRNASLVGLSFCFEESNAYYVPIAHRDPQSKDFLPNQMDWGGALKILKQRLKDKKISGQNLKFDLSVLRNAGLEFPLENIAFDSMIASYVLEPEGRHGLDSLTEKFLSHKNISFEEICGSGKNEITFDFSPLDKAGEYAAEDAHVAFLLEEKLLGMLENSPSLKKVFYEIDLPLVPVLADMEFYGVAINSAHLQKVSQEFAKDLELLEKEAYSVAGEEFNLSSPKQLQKILFDQLQLPSSKKTKTGYSTDVDVLKKLSSLHPLPALILEHRELSKLKSTYVDVLPELVSPKTNRVHAQFNQTVAATGRLSSSEPNLQNIPIRTQSGKLVRQAFVAEKGKLLLGADYSQIELRILASMSGDALLTKAFWDNTDVHSLTASQIFSVPIQDVNEEERRKAKAINFGLIYGKSAFSLAEELRISRSEAADIIKQYFSQYPTIREFLDSLFESAKKTGYAETLFGRRRAIEGIHSSNKMILGMAERMAINTPIQGTAADLVKIAMIQLHKALHREKLQSRLILQVHDELVLEVPENEIEQATFLVREVMEKAGEGKIRVPLVAQTGIGHNWLEL